MKISNHRKVAAPKLSNQQVKKAAAKKRQGGGDVFEGVSNNMSEGEMLKKQAEMQKQAEIFQMKSNLLQVQHDMRKNILANFRV